MVIDLLMQFGSTEKAGSGATRIFFDKAGRRQVKNYAGPIAAMLEEHLDIYALVSPEGQVITVAHRLERIKRH